MAIPDYESSIGIGGYGWVNPYQSKADEVEKLVSVAESCGIEKDIKLFDYLVNLVYRGSARAKGSPKGLSEFLVQPSDVKITDEDVPLLKNIATSESSLHRYQPIASELTINVGSPTEEMDIDKVCGRIADVVNQAKGACI